MKFIINILSKIGFVIGSILGVLHLFQAYIETNKSQSFIPKTREISIEYVFVFVVALAALVGVALVKLYLQRRNFSNTWYLEVKNETEVTERILNPERGIMMHGDMRHVLFWKNTILKVMENAFPNKDKNKDYEYLKNKGREMGTCFGSGFVEHLRREKLLNNMKESTSVIKRMQECSVYARTIVLFKKIELLRKLGHVAKESLTLFLKEFRPKEEKQKVMFRESVDRWCAFELSRGWGKWEHYLEQYTTEGSEGTIKISNNFLSDCAIKNTKTSNESKSNTNVNYCVLLEGYISSLLETLSTAISPEYKWESYVSENSNCCDTITPCEFTYVLKKANSELTNLG